MPGSTGVASDPPDELSGSAKADGRVRRFLCRGATPAWMPGSYNGRAWADQPWPGSSTVSMPSDLATARTSGSAVAILAPGLAEAMSTASASEIGRAERW